MRIITRIRFDPVVIICALSVAVLIAIPISAVQQSVPAKPLAFDVASVKPSPDPRTTRGVFRPDPGSAQPGGTWVASFAPLEDIIRSAYPDFALPGQIVDGPSWLTTDRFEIIAKTDSTRTNDEMRAMVRALLSERFQLSLHFEMREMPVYFLVRARDDGKLGPGLRIPEVDCDKYRAAKARGEPLPQVPVRAADRLPCTATIMNSRLSSTGRGTRITAGGTTISGITSLIALLVSRPVVDQSGLTQPFDIEVEFSIRPLSADPSVALDLPSIFDAMQAELGLKLQSGRAPVNVLVIDRVERPTPD